MDEYLSEKEQIERLRQWWRDNGWFLLGGVALGLLVLFGYNQYREYQNRQAEQAAAIFEELKQVADGVDVNAAAALVTQLRNEYPKSVYTDHAGLLIAKMQLVTDPERAIEELRFVMENTKERELSMIARTRLARALAYREQYDEALRVLEVTDPGQFAARINEIKGDIYTALGRTEDARSAYLSALTASGAEVLDRNFLQMKLNDLPSSPGIFEQSVPASTDAAAGSADAAESADSAGEAPADAPPEPDAADESASGSTAPQSDAPAAGDAAENGA